MFDKIKDHIGPDDCFIGCGHKVTVKVIDSNPLSVANYMQFIEENPKHLCLDCYDKDTEELN